VHHRDPFINLAHGHLFLGPSVLGFLPRIDFENRERESGRNRFTGLSFTSRVPRDSRLKFWIVITRNVNSDFVRTTIATSRTLPVCFSVFSARCERRPRSLLIITSNRELEVDRRSISLLYIATSTLYRVNIVQIKPSETQDIFYYPNSYQPSDIRMTDSDRRGSTGDRITKVDNGRDSISVRSRIEHKRNLGRDGETPINLRSSSEPSTS